MSNYTPLFHADVITYPFLNPVAGLVNLYQILWHIAKMCFLIIHHTQVLQLNENYLLKENKGHPDLIHGQINA